MSLLETLLKTEKKHELGVCIPEHIREKQEEVNRETRKAIELEKRTEIIPGKTIGSFRVTGLYDVGKDFVLTGKVERGRLEKKMKSELQGKNFSLKQIEVKGLPVKLLNSGERGTIYVDKNLIGLKTGDLLEFWQ